MATKKRLIDAMQAVTEMSGRIVPMIRMGENPMQIYNEVLQVLAEAPTVDAVEVVRGSWELYPSSMHRRCSVCKREYEKPKYDIRANYCPNCGADMRGDGDGK